MGARVCGVVGAVAILLDFGDQLERDVGHLDPLLRLRVWIDHHTLDRPRIIRRQCYNFSGLDFEPYFFFQNRPMYLIEGPF